MKRLYLLFLIGFVLLRGNPAMAREELRLRLVLSGFYYQEQELFSSVLPTLATMTRIGMGDARVILDGRNLRGKLDVRVDLRSRISGTVVADASSFDFEAKFQPQYAATPQNTTAYQGYLGGPEFLDLREMYLRLLVHPRIHVSLGRMFIVESDAMKIDGARIQADLSDVWEAGLFLGGAPNPYSRYLLTDYDPPCGNGVAAGSDTLKLESPIAPAAGVTPPSAVAVAPDPCQRSGPQLALTTGITARFKLRQVLWGTIGLTGAFYGGPGAGGAVVRDPAVSDRIGNLLPADTERDAPRTFLSFTTQATPLPRLQLFSDVVIDLTGSSGAQLTRAVLTANLLLLPENRLSLRATYSYLSSLAIGMYLRNFFYNRNPNGTTLGGLGVVENNLSLLRTGRHEGRLFGNLHLFRATHLFVEGRLRQRSLLNGETSPDVYLDPRYTDNTRNLAGDATFGLRDNGSLKSLRGLLSYTFLQDFRARNHNLRVLFGYGLRRDGRELLTLETEYAALFTADEGANADDCLAAMQAAAGSGDGRSQIDPRLSVFLPGCFGRRSGVTHEAGLTATLSPTARIFLLLDYRFTAMLSDRQPTAAPPTVLGHALLLRLEGSIALLRP